MITKADFIDWKSNPVTKAVFMEIKKLADDGVEGLSLSAGLDPLNDRAIVGKINGLRNVLDISFSDIGGTDD